MYRARRSKLAMKALRSSAANTADCLESRLNEISQCCEGQVSEMVRAFKNGGWSRSECSDQEVGRAIYQAEKATNNQAVDAHVDAELTQVPM